MKNEEKFKLLPKPTNPDIQLLEIQNIGNPHLYCITPKHMLPNRMYLGEAEIREAEETNGAVCDICKRSNRKEQTPILKYDEHKERNILFVEIVVVDGKPRDIDDLNTYFKSIAKQLEEYNVEGVSLVKAKKVKAKKS